MFGMTEKEFWEDDPQLYWSYQIFYIKKVEQENEQLNNNAWLQGIYTLLAHQQALNGFGKTQKEIYPKKPIDFNSDSSTTKPLTREEKDEIVRQEFNHWARIL